MAWIRVLQGIAIALGLAAAFACGPRATAISSNTEAPGPNITPTPLQQPSAVPKPVATIAGGSPSGGGTSLPSASPESTPTREFEIITVIPRDAIRAILEPEFLSVEEAIYHEPDEPVLGVSINGDNRAYSIPQLSRHEIVNDVVGGVPIAVTW